ncbi:hypothetical protein [Streptomyces olivaceus]|uniref:hypothetical protein n=1 Tax=Streptomyces olivaceus TaxID=47716 RepID=UPI00188504C3|nr:hypothetical protein [Streptomyces olivaceus]
MQPGTHFAFGTHPEHGFVASSTASLPAHLTHWFLEREQFEPVPDEPGLFRLREPERDGARRTRQAVLDLRSHGYTVQADMGLDPQQAAAAARPTRPHGLQERRSLARAAAGRTTERATAPATSPPSARPIPPKPSHAPAVHLTAVGTGRSR